MLERRGLGAAVRIMRRMRIRRRMPVARRKAGIILRLAWRHQTVRYALAIEDGEGDAKQDGEFERDAHTAIIAKRAKPVR
jgi:hypothetical protein